MMRNQRDINEALETIKAARQAGKRPAIKGKDLRAVTWPGKDLHRTDLRQVDMREANLSGANLSGGHFVWSTFGLANLSGANFSRTKFSRTDLSGANLIGADLSGANLTGAYLSGADLSGANLMDAKFASERLIDAAIMNAVIDWRVNSVVATILFHAARDDNARNMVAGLVLLRDDMYFLNILNLPLVAASRDWAIETLKKWVRPEDNAPDILR